MGMRNGKYTLVKAPENYPGKKYRGRYCYEHHLVYWQHFGVIPDENSEIHHKNEDTRDNSIGNLELLVGIRHKEKHGQCGEKSYRRFEVICPTCKEVFVVKGNRYRQRLKENKMGKLFCSRKCATLYQFSVGRYHNGSEADC